MNVLPVAPTAPPPPKVNGPSGFEDQFHDVLSEVRKDATDDVRDANQPAAGKEPQSDPKTGAHTTTDPDQPAAADAADQNSNQAQASSKPKDEATAGNPQQPAAANEPAKGVPPHTEPPAAPVQTAGLPNGNETTGAATDKPAAAGSMPAAAETTPAAAAATGAVKSQKPAAESKPDAKPTASTTAATTSTAPAATTAAATAAQATQTTMAMAGADTGLASPTRTGASANATPTGIGNAIATVPAFAGAPTGNAATSPSAGQPTMPQNAGAISGQAELPKVQNLAKADLLASTTAGAAHAAANQTGEAASGNGGTMPAGGIGATAATDTAGGGQSSTATASPSRSAANMQGPTMQVAVQIARAAQDGVNQIQVRLNPAELGRVDVKLDVGHDGRVIAVVTADKQETLDLLQRDQRGLERALQDAGLQTNSGGLSFSLRHDGADAQQTAGGNGTDADMEPEAGDADPASTSSASRPDGLLDISV